MRLGSLFTGYGGLDMAIAAVLPVHTVWVCDNDPAAAAVLAYRWPRVPNLGDITAVDWDRVGPVDVLAGGSPCQDISGAGSRKGMRTGTRSGLWASMCDAIGVLRPSLVLWENVRGAASAEADSDLESCPGCVGNPGDRVVLRALGRVLADLADLGYDAVWCGLRAADIGAPHGRFRIFLAATDTLGEPGQQRRLATPREARSGRTFGPAAGRGGTPAADTYGDGCGVLEWIEPSVGTQGDADGRGPTGVDWGRYEPAIRRWEHLLGRPAPVPTVTGTRGGRVLNPALAEWMMGLPAGWITAVPGIARNDQLRLTGNGVIPQQATAAYRFLLPLLLGQEVAG
ncbi:DNA cytosine methyltransferase [Sciscionella sediminilitoris]|uniref:DNA cytosine methyltransferase n=1 Tax=Sciscionella sediminilitoris TaxID=1445613 RepID=UPI0004DF92FF|nr:DNA cytosine methyltransferase [Sciscionella sp. SE31]